MHLVCLSRVRWAAPALALSLAFFSNSDALADKRVALVVGNNAYDNVPKLDKAVNDATAVASALKSIGFEVQLATDVGRRDFIRQLAEFTGHVDAGDLALFYFAGHGIEIRGANYVLPADVPAVREGQESLITNEAIATEKIISDLQDRGARATVLVLDACRDNPFKGGGTRSIGGVRGLAVATAPEGVFVLYSAGVGQSALDRISDADPNPNSVFTRVLLKEVSKADATLVDVAKSVQVAVRDLSQTVGHTQVPAYYDQIIGQLRLVSTSDDGRNAGLPIAPPEGKAIKLPPVANAPSEPPPRSRATFNNRAFTAYLGLRARLVKGPENWAIPGAAATCDRLASYGPDVPDSRAPRVPLQEIRVKEAVPACIAAVFQDPATPRVRAQLARALLQSPDKRVQTAGLDILLDLAKDGYPAAMWRIGIAYLNGGLLKKDPLTAVAWTRAAAEKGLGAAMSDLGVYYVNGEGVPKSLSEAAKWFERAAANGHPDGMRNYALILDEGEGIARNPTRSAEYLLTAFRMGSEAARKSLFELHASWHPDTKAQVQKLLKDYGFYNGRTDGEFDTETFAALDAIEAASAPHPR